MTYLLGKKSAKCLGIGYPLNHPRLGSGGDDFVGAYTQTTTSRLVVVE